MHETDIEKRILRHWKETRSKLQETLGGEMKKILIGIFALLALFTSACGGSDSEGGAQTSTSASEQQSSSDSSSSASEETAAEETAAEEAEPEETAAEEAEPEETTVEEEVAGPVAADESLPPVRIGLLNQENDPVGSFPEIRLGIEGAVAYINAELGGIGGHPIELVTCLQNSIPKAQECAQDLATSDLVSVINGVNIWTFAFDFYGTMGETPVIGGLPLFASDYNQPNARYLTAAVYKYILLRLALSQKN